MEKNGKNLPFFLHTCEIYFAVQILYLRRSAQLEQMRAQGVNAINYTRHVFFVVNIRRFRLKSLHKKFV